MIGLSEFSKKQLVFVFACEGEKLSFKNDNVVVKDKDGKTKFQILFRTMDYDVWN